MSAEFIHKLTGSSEQECSLGDEQSSGMLGFAPAPKQHVTFCWRFLNKWLFKNTTTIVIYFCGLEGEEGWETEEKPF